MAENRLNGMEMSEEMLDGVTGGTGNDGPVEVSVTCATNNKIVRTLASRMQIVKEICPVCGKQFTCKIEVIK